MTLTQLVVIALATWQAVEIWHHSSLFAGPRARVELWDGKLAELLLCPFCLSVWVAVGVTYVVRTEVTWPAAGLNLWEHVWLATGYLLMNALMLFVVGLAGSRLANLGNDLTHGYCRTFRGNKFESHYNDSDSKNAFEAADDTKLRSGSAVSDTTTEHAAGSSDV